MFFFPHLLHTASKAWASRLERRNTYIIKCFSSVPKRPISSNTCIKNSCLPHTAAKDLASVYFLGGYMFFFYNLPHTAGKAQASRLQQRKTCIIKCFSRVPKQPISFSMCIKNSSLLHTAAEDRASVYFLGGIRSFFTVSRTRLLRLELRMIFLTCVLFLQGAAEAHKGLKKTILYKNKPFSKGSKQPIPF